MSAKIETITDERVHIRRTSDPSSYAALVLLGGLASIGVGTWFFVELLPLDYWRDRALWDNVFFWGLGVLSVPVALAIRSYYAGRIVHLEFDHKARELRISDLGKRHTTVISYAYIAQVQLVNEHFTENVRVGDNYIRTQKTRYLLLLNLFGLSRILVHRVLLPKQIQPLHENLAKAIHAVPYQSPGSQDEPIGKLPFATAEPTPDTAGLLLNWSAKPGPFLAWVALAVLCLAVPATTFFSPFSTAGLIKLALFPVVSFGLLGYWLQTQNRRERITLSPQGLSFERSKGKRWLEQQNYPPQNLGGVMYAALFTAQREKHFVLLNRKAAEKWRNLLQGSKPAERKLGNIRAAEGVSNLHPPRQNSVQGLALLRAVYIIFGKMNLPYVALNAVGSQSPATPPESPAAADPPRES